MPGRALSLTLLALAVACSARHDAPFPDSRQDAPPDVQGRISRIGDSTVTLDTDPPVDIALRGTTRIFTVHGGYVAPGDLVVGMRARVWLDRTSMGPLKVAAAVMVASKNPEDDWP